jgi:RecJ-like exonuclease
LVKVTGKIIKITKTNTTFLRLKDETGTIDAVVFQNAIKDMEKLRVGQTIEVIGRPEKYKEKMEITVVSIQ